MIVGQMIVGQMVFDQRDLQAMKQRILMLYKYKLTEDLSEKENKRFIF
jgi:hypothetical protein